jgi:hypothetical protein
MRATTPRQNKWLSNVGAMLLLGGIIADWVLPGSQNLEGLAYVARLSLIPSVILVGSGLMVYAMLTRPPG